MPQLNTDEVNLRVVLDGSPARKELATLDQSMVTTRDRIKELMSEQDRLNKVMKESRGGSDEYLAASKSIEKNRQELVGLRTELTASTARASELRKEIGIGALSVRELRNEAAKLRILRDTASGSSQAFAQFDAQLTEVNARIKVLTNEAAKQAAAWEAVRGQYKLSQLSMQQLELEAQRLKLALSTMAGNDPGLPRLRAQLQAVEAQTAKVRTGLGPFGQAWQTVKTQIMGAGAVLGTFLAGGAIISTLKSWVTSSAKLSDAQAEVARTTGLAKADVDDLTRSLSKLNTRTARADLLELAKEAGKLGISAKEDVLAFVSAGDKINVALGEELGEGAIEQLGKLNQTFKVTSREGFSLSKGLLASGSAINDLANASTADGSFLVDYATRLGGVNTQANISIENTLGYAAALDQLGQRSETSSTAVSRFTLGAFKDTAEYAKIAGMSVKDFTKLLKTDTNEALLRVLKGLNGNSAGLALMTEKFKDLGQEGARSVGVLASLANNTDLIRKQQDIANKSFAEGTSVLTAFDRKNSTLGANLDILGKKMAGAFVNSGVVKGINSIVGALADWERTSVSDNLEQERISMEKTYAEILQYNVGTTERTKLIKELQEKYPDFLKNIDAEKVGNEDLATAVKGLNEQLINKIILQKQDEKIEDAAKTVADQKLQVFEFEDEVRTKLVQLAEKENIQIKAGVPLLQQAIQLQDDILEKRRKAGQLGLGGLLTDPVARFAKSIDALDGAYQVLNGDLSLNNRLSQERKDLMDRLGIKTDSPTPVSTAGGTGGGDGANDVDEEEKKKRDAALKAMQDLRDDLLKLRRGIELDGMSSDEREIAQLDDKYAEIRKKTLANTQHTAEDVAALEDTYELARADLLEKQANERAAKVAAARLKAAEEVEKVEDGFWESHQSDEDLAITKELQRLDELTALYDAAGIDTQDIVLRTEEAIDAIHKKFRDKEKKDAQQTSKEALQQRLVTYRAVAGSLGAMNDLLQASYQSTGKTNYQQTEQARVLGLAQIAVASGVGVAEAIKAGAGIPLPANLGAIAAGVTAVLGGVASAIALLSNQQTEAPTDGTASAAGPAINAVPIGADGMVLSGPSHRNKGLSVINNQTGKQEAELEGDELVMSKRFTAANADQLPQLLAASKAGSRLHFLSAAPDGINVRAYQAAERTVRLADGGFLGSGAVLDAIASSRGGSSSYDPGVLQALDRVSKKLDKLDDLIEVSARNKEAILRVGPGYDQTLETWDKLKRRNSIARA